MGRNKTARHEAIVTAARREFMKYGYADASMRRIADTVGMSVSGLYKHFSGKEEMFAALVEPAFQGLMALYRQEEAAQNEALQAGQITEKWEEGGEARLLMTYIYEHVDEFRLLICRSRGTRYETFLHDLAIEEEKTMTAMMDMLKEQGTQIKDVDPHELHLLVTANLQAVFEAVEHNFPRDKAMHYADTLDRFFTRGWQELFGY